MRRLLLTVATLICLPLGGCVNGAVYQHTIEPLDVNLSNTPVGSKSGTADMKDFNFQYVRITWDGNDLAGAAKNAGIQEVYYADVERFSVLGIWSQTYAHVYGK